jgi:aryl-alcohol dehydrogenase-like predicted oxidoreductase
VKHDVNLITRVVDYGGLFHDDVKPGHKFGQQDHRAFRPVGWVDAGNEKMDRMRDIAAKHKLTMLQLACLWNLSQSGVKSVIPTLIQEAGEKTKTIETKVDELASLPDTKLTTDECEAMAEIGDNKGCMELKGANRAYVGEPQPDRWGLTPDHELIAKRCGIDPDADLACTHKITA